MKAIRVHEFGDANQMRLEEVDTPQVGPMDVLVRVAAAGVNPVDTYIRSGQHAVRPQLPYTPGADGAGVALEIGKNVSRIKRGDRVYLAGSKSGSYAELSLCGEEQVYPLPSQTSFEEGAALGVPYATAYRALHQLGRAAAGQSVLVNGASGGVGIAAVQLAVAAGLNVIGTAGTEAGIELVKRQGARHAFNHHDPDLAQKVLNVTGTCGTDLILEMLANENLAADFGMIAKRGRILIIGNRGTTTINPRDIMTKEAIVMGVFLFNSTHSEKDEAHAALYKELESGALRPLVGERIPLREAPRAHQAVLANGVYGKIVLIP